MNSKQLPIPGLGEELATGTTPGAKINRASWFKQRINEVEDRLFALELEMTLLKAQVNRLEGGSYE